jgi:uncharacterized membrane protein
MRHTQQIIAAATLALFAAFATVATPAAALSVGDKLEQHLILGNKQIPLPAGEWVLGGLGTQAFQMPAVGAFGTIETAVLLRISGEHVVAVLEVNANQIPVNDGWGRTKSCVTEGRQLLVITRYKTGWETACAFVQPTRFGGNSAGPPAWEQARDFARSHALTMPALWLTAGFRISDRQDLIDARYHFDPALLMGATAARYQDLSDWTKAAAAADPLRANAVQMVSAWASGFGAWVEKGMRNQIANTPDPMPEVAAYLSNTPFVDAKLRDLDRLYRNGQVSWDSYIEQSHKAINEVPLYQPQVSLVSNSIKKNMSFRFFGTFVDYAIAYVVTASNAVSWGIALTINSTDSFWFVLNDQYWDDYYAKQNTHDSERLVDFTYIGGGANA